MNEFLSNAKQRLLRKAIQSGIRADSREIFSFRNLKIMFNKDNENVEVTLGETKVTSHIEVSITEPRIDRQGEGFINFKVDLNVLQSTYSFKQIKERNDEIVKILDKTIRGSRFNN